MARALNSYRNADVELREAFIAYKKYMQQFFPTDHRLETIAKLERGEPVYVPIVDLWQAAFRAKLPDAEDIREASVEPLIIEISGDGVFVVGVQEGDWHDKPSLQRNQQRDAINTRWLRR